MLRPWLRPLLRRIVGALDARPDLEGAVLLAAILGWQTGWLWHQLVWPGETGQLVLGAVGVALGLAVGGLGGLAAQRHPWVGRLQVLGLPGLVVGVATGYAVLQLGVADLLARTVPLGLPPSTTLVPWWPVGNGSVAVLLAAGWGATLFRLARLARSPVVAAPALAPPLEQRLVATGLAWLGRQGQPPPRDGLARAVARLSDATRGSLELPPDNAPVPVRHRWWVVAFSLLIGWPRLPRSDRR